VTVVRRIAVSGAAGLVGTALRSRLQGEGWRWLRLVRRPARAAHEIAYDPAAGSIDADRLAGIDAVVHLAGESIAGGRWTPARKQRILSSRVDGTRLIAGTLAGLDKPPRTLISASAIGYYGGRGGEPLDEGAAAGTGFLPDLCTAWEAATGMAERAGVRVVRLRIGIVLAQADGALAKMLPVFRLGLGGRLGSGAQYMSWVSLTDLVSIIRFLLDAPQLAGPVNAVAPGAVTNAEYTRTLGKVLGRPAVLPAPACALRLALGEMADALLLEGARVIPTALSRAGFRFKHPDLATALRAELGL